MGKAKAHGRGSHLLVVAAGVLAVTGGGFGARVATTLVASAATPALTFSAPVSIDTNEITGVSCPVRTFCAAVDSSGNVLTTGNPSGGAAAWTVAKIDTQATTGISCPTVTLCVVGDSFGRVLASSNPTGGAASWSTATVAPGAFFLGPSCPTVTFCAIADQAAGVVTSSNPAGGAAAWTVTNLPVVRESGVACPTSSLCVVSDSGNVLTSTNPAGGTGTWVTASVDPNGQGLRGVSCPSVSLCVAVDGAGQVAATTNPRGGSSNFWITADVDGTNSFNALSCPSTAPGLCVALDDGGNVVSSTVPAAGAGAWAAQNVFGTTAGTAAGCADNGFCVVADANGRIAIGTAGAGGPAVSGIAPAQGPTAGGGSVTLTGSGFSTAAGATAVDFGTTAASGVTCSSTTSCTAVEPAGAPGAVNITATVGGLTSAAGPLNAFTFVAPGPPPAISGLSPPSGPAGGGTSVTITGSGFDTTPGATTVTFGGQAASNVSCSTATTCVVTDPPSIGPQIVIATVAGQTSSGSSASTFAYRPPFVAAISPGNGSTAGGTAVTMSGANFDTVPGTTHVSFGSQPAAAVSCPTATTCVATSPPGTGAVFLSVSEGPVTTPPSSVVSFTYVTPPVATVSCGATVTQSVTLTQDLGPCPGNGLVVQASGITVDLEGHRIFGTADGSDNRVGIELARVTGVSITGSAGKATAMGDVDGFASGVGIDGGSHNTITKLDVHDNVGPPTFASNRGDGIVIGAVTASAHNVISSSVVAHNGVYDGVGVFSAQSKGNQIVNTRITDNNISVTVPDSVMVDDGVNLGSGLEGSNSTTISGDTISRNGYNGIDACSAEGTPPCSSVGNVITGNVVDANGTTGQATRGINISVLVPGMNSFPGTFDIVRDNQVLDNLGVGIFLNNPNNTVTNNVVLGNSSDSTAWEFGAPYDLYDNSGGPTCDHNNWHGNTFDVNEAYPACTTKGGTAVQPPPPGGAQARLAAPPSSWRRGQQEGGSIRGG